MRATGRSLPLASPATKAVATAAPRPAPRPAGEPPKPTPAPASTASDRLRLAATPFPPNLAGFADAIGLLARREALHAGRPAVSPAERGKLAAALGRLDRAQLLALRKALIEQPPHPELRKMRGHPAVSGPPTARGLLEIFTGEPLGLAGPKDVVRHVFAPGTPVELDGVSYTIRGRGYPDPSGESRVVLAGPGGARLVDPVKLLEAAPALLDRTRAVDVRGVTESDVRGGPPVLDHSASIFAVGRRITLDGASARIMGRDPATGRVTVQRELGRLEVEPERILLQNPAIVPPGIELFASVDGSVVGGLRLLGLGRPGTIRVVGDGEPIDVPVAALLAHNRVGLLGGAAAERAPLSPAAPGGEPVTPSEAREVLKPLDRDYERLSGLVAELYRAAEHAPATVRRRIDDFGAQAGATLHEMRGLRERLLLEHQAGLTPPTRDEVRAALARFAEAPAALAAAAPYSKSKLLGTLAKARPAEASPFATPADLNDHLDERLRPVVLGAADPATRAYARPLFFAENALVTAPSGRAASPAETSAIAREAANDPRLVTEHLETGCYARAQVLAERLEAAGLFAAKLFVEDEQGLRAKKDGREVEWGYHVAAVTLERAGPGQPARLVVIDPAFSATPLSLEDWARPLLGSKNFAVEFHLRQASVYGPNDEPADRAVLLTESWRKLAELAELERGGRR